VCDQYLTRQDDSLFVPWAEVLGDGLGWLNPPFNAIPRWARKCRDEALLGARVLFLVPASVASEWYWSYCAGYETISICPRLVFDGTPVNPKTGRPDPFMKDLMLVNFGNRLDVPESQATLARWRWR
jgi:hypothetical protein